MNHRDTSQSTEVTGLTTSSRPLQSRLPPEGTVLTPDDLLQAFLEYATEKGLSLYPAQEDAILALFDGANVILNTPTGSGKSLVATALHFYALANGRKSYYTCPIKALVNEKFLALCKDFGPEHVGLITGDATVNPDAAIICCTAEILANLALREGASAPVQDVVMDEFHYFSDRDRGWAWQVPLLTLSYSRFLLMSATLGPTEEFEKKLVDVTGQRVEKITSVDRPVPLEFEYRETPLHETIQDLIFGGKSPVYLVNFTQRECAEEAQNLLSVDIASKTEKLAIQDLLVGFKFSSPFGKEFQKLLRHGIGLHHAGLLPKYRLLTEKLAQQGLLKVIVGTDTLGVGVNIPIRSVLFTKLCKFDGEKTTILSVRDFQQISGRAGRKGFDTQGTVIVQAPEHVIQNKVMELKARLDPKKAKKMVKKKPPEKGYIHWDQLTFEKLKTSPPELLKSRFQITHSILLNLLSRPGDGCRATKLLIRDSFETPTMKRQLVKTGFQLFRSLLVRNIVEIMPKEEWKSRKVRVHADLQEDFSLNHALSLYLIDTIKLLDKNDPEYALTVLTLVESILENPDLILRKQLDRLKSEKMAEMKAEGIEYDDRIAELEKLEYPKPCRDFIYTTFNEFSRLHPWVGEENIRPKLVAREMFEQYLTFDEYIREYDIHRAEGVLLRYLTEVYKTLVQTVPESDRNEEILAMLAYFREMVRTVDESLLAEWESLRHPSLRKKEANLELSEQPQDITSDKKQFTILVRNYCYQLLRVLAQGDVDTIITAFGDKGWDKAKFDDLGKEYSKDHQGIDTGRAARLNDKFSMTWTTNACHIEQVICDHEGHNDWSLKLELDLIATKQTQSLQFSELNIGPIG